MRVAYLGTKGLPATGGTERVVETLVTHLLEHDVAPTVYCDRRYHRRPQSLPGVRLVRVPALPGKYLGPISYNMLAALHAVLCGNYDFVHLHNAEASFVLPLLRLRYPVIATAHGPAHERAKWAPLAKRLMCAMQWPFVHYANLVTSVSRTHARLLEQRYGRSVTYVANGVDPVRLDADETRAVLRQHGLEPKGYVMFAAARIEPTKGLHLAIGALETLAGAPPLLVVGDESHGYDYCRALREQAGARVRFHGSVTCATLAGLIAEARVLIFPSLLEGMSMLLLEAAATGTPIVCSDIEENRCVLGEDASFFSSGSAKSLARVLDEALSYEALRVDMGRRAQARVAREFSGAAIARRYAELYAQLRTELVHLEPAGIRPRGRSRGPHSTSRVTDSSLPP